MKHGQTPSWKENCETITKISNGLRAQQNDTFKPANKNKIGKLMNHAYNNSKHAGKTKNTLQMDPKSSAQTTIERAILNYEKLFPLYDLAELPLSNRFLKELADKAYIAP